MGILKSRLPRLESLEDRCLLSGDVVLHWNEILLQSLPSQPPRVPLARNVALVHVAMFDAVNSIERTYEPYAANVSAPYTASLEAAAAQAAHDTLAALYPTRQAIFDAALASDLAGIPLTQAQQGILVGQQVAQQILTLRSNDGAAAIMSYIPPNTDPGQYQLTPPNFAAAANVQVPFITPFAVQSSSQFRPGPFPALDSPEYAADLNEVKLIGASDADTADHDGNGLLDRTADQTLVAELWRLPLTNHAVWNRIAQDQAAAHDLSLTETARLFALLDMAINDGLQTSNESKYHYVLWRPITAIRRAGEDGNDATVAEAGWMTEHPTTPPYPAYASNASAIGTACASVLAGVLGSDNVPFEVNWASYTPLGGPRSYSSFSAAADEMANSRIYGGIHFRFDCVAGQAIGRNVGAYVVGNYLLPHLAKIESVVVNDGSAQRSTVNSITVTFDRVVTLDAGAFVVQRNDGSEVSVSVAASVVDNRTVAVLTFTGSGVIGGSLADGNYTLTIRSDHIRDRQGRDLDGDRDGNSGGNRVDTFSRLFGDSDGDGDVDRLNRDLFRAAFRAQAGEAGYLWYFDFDGDGDVDGYDNGQFNRRFGRS